MARHASPLLPASADLRRLIHFSAHDGRIWLAGQRMVLIHAASLGALRRELMQSAGADETRRLFTRAGFAAGQRDATLAREIRGDGSLYDMFAVGLQLHMLEGAVQVMPLRFEADPASGHFYAEHQWEHSWEAEVHKRDFGPQTHPVCWMLIGYASGYTSEFMGRTIVFRETACTSMNDAHCHIVGKPLQAWPDADELWSWFRAEPFSGSPDTSDIPNTPDTAQGAATAAAFPVSSGIAEDAGVARAADETRLTGSSESGGLVGLTGQSAAFRAACEQLRIAASTSATVLITGETGTGKERLARALHALGSRAAKPFVVVNCAAMARECIDAELFGVKKTGTTFPGFHTAQAGQFGRADGGTLFLDEIDALPPDMQAKLLCTMQENETRWPDSSGSAETDDGKLDVRIVAATCRNLAHEVQEGRFRADLYYRLNVCPVPVPPLRDRRDDIEPLARAMLAHFAALHGKPTPAFTDHAYDALRHHAWPGNLRELEQLVERAVVLSKPDREIGAQALFPDARAPQGATLDHAGRLQESSTIGIDCQTLLDQLRDSGKSLEELEWALLHEAVERTNGNLSAAARLLGLTRAQLSYRLGRRPEPENHKESTT